MRSNLMKIIYDPSWKDSIRCEALHVLDRTLIGIPRHGSIFRDLLKDVKEKLLPDIKNDLRGTLLNHMYPGELQPTEAWGLLSRRKCPIPTQCLPRVLGSTH